MLMLFRVVDLNLRTYVCCSICRRRAAYSVLNRIFGNSQTACDFCGRTLKDGDE